MENTFKNSNLFKYPEVDWSLPILFSNDEYILAISNVMKRLNLPNPVTYAYGMVPSLWTGGRFSPKRSQDKTRIANILKMIISTGTIPTFTVSRYDIEDSDLNDEFCNWILDFGVENNCRFIITSDKLFNYIKSRYPEAKCVASVLKTIYELESQDLSETEYYNMLLDKYDWIVARPEYCLSTILEEHEKISDISRVEVLINQICVPNCKVAIEEHLEIPRHDWIKFTKNISLESSTKCPRMEIEKKLGMKYNLTSPTLIFSEKEVDNLVYNIGIRNLKLQGRNYSDFLNTRLMNNYIFEEIGDFQNISPIIWGNREMIKQRGVVNL